MSNSMHFRGKKEAWLLLLLVVKEVPPDHTQAFFLQIV
jgi:hypothetical protein